MNPSTQKHLVIIGTGMAGGRLLDELMQLDRSKYKISVFGEEPHPNYNRIMLSPLLAGDVTADQIILNSLDWYQEHGITLYKNERITGIDCEQKTLVSQQGTELSYDELVFATGSLPFRVPTPGDHLKNIYLFRTIEDVDAILTAAQSAENAVVIGGGLLGLEAAYGLAIKGVHTTVVNRAPYLLNRQLDAESGEMLRETLLEKGIDTRLDNQVDAFLGDECVSGALLGSGEILKADLVIIAIGITPNTALAQSAGLNVGRGIIVDDSLCTSNACVSALGECIEHRGETFGLVAPIWDQAQLLAERLVFGNETQYASKAVPTKLKVSGVDLFSAGLVDAEQGDRTLTLKDPTHRAYRKLILRDQRIVGIVLFGDVQDGNWYFELLEQQTKVDDLLPHLLYGKSFCTLTEAHTNQPNTPQPNKALTGASS